MTVCGDSFPNRVAASLYASFLRPDFYLTSPQAGEVLYERTKRMNSILVATTVKELEDTAVRLLKPHTGALAAMTTNLHRLIESSVGVFDTPRAVHTFLRSMKAMFEAYALQPRQVSTSSRRYNIIIV